jgi:hypothetical protein
MELRSKKTGGVLETLLWASIVVSAITFIMTALYVWNYELYFSLEMIDTFSSLFFMFTYILTGITYIIWIFKVHKDLQQLDPNYPVSPGGAMLRIWVPFYSLFYGLWNIYSSMYRFFIEYKETKTLGLMLIKYVPFYYGLFLITSILDRIFSNEERAMAFFKDTYEAFLILSYALDAVLLIIYLQMVKLVTKALYTLFSEVKMNQVNEEIQSENGLEKASLNS